MASGCGVFDTKTAVLAGGISYQVGSEQYVAVAVGGPMPGGYYAPNGARLLVFKLGGKAVLPDLPAYTQPPIAPPPQRWRIWAGSAATP